MKHIRKITAAAALVLGAGAVQAADVVIGVPNWPSVNATANVLKVIIEDNYGLDVELQNGTIPSSSKPWTRAACTSIPRCGCRTRPTCTRSSSSRRVRCS